MNRFHFARSVSGAAVHGSTGALVRCLAGAACAALCLTHGVPAGAQPAEARPDSATVAVSDAWTPDDQARVDEALAAWAEGGVADADVLFNAGIGFARRGELGRAVLALERAQLLRPQDRGIYDARQRVQEHARREHAASSQRFHTGEPRSVGWWRLFRALPLLAWQLLAIAGAWILGVCGLGWMHSAVVRQRVAVALVTAAVASLIGLVGAAGWLGRTVWTAQAAPVVLVASRPVYREAPDELARTRRHADMYSGAVVVARGSRDGGWLQVELASGDRVWISGTDAAPIDVGARLP